MKAWWENLSQRERIIVLAGTGVGLILVLYFALWGPVNNAVEDLQTKVSSQKATAQMLINARERIARLKTAGYGQTQPSTQALLVVVEKSLADAKLSNYVAQVQQPLENELNLTLKNVPFDPMIEFFQNLWKQQNINISQIDVKKTNTAGVVDAQVTFIR